MPLYHVKNPLKTFTKYGKRYKVVYATNDFDDWAREYDKLRRKSGHPKSPAIKIENYLKNHVHYIGVRKAT